jgi:anthranilate/para-aminobenzoate synthase component II
MNPMHGRDSLIEHDSQGIFAATPSPLRVARYHSLIVDPHTVPDVLRVTATTADGTIMAIEHSHHPTIGLQFHPESILTEHGSLLLANFLRLSGLTPLARISPVPTSGIHSP